MSMKENNSTVDKNLEANRSSDVVAIGYSEMNADHLEIEGDFE